MTLHTARSQASGSPLKIWPGRGLPFRAIGIFDTGASSGGLHGAERADAARIILNDYPQKALFALRPLNENHCPEAYPLDFQRPRYEIFPQL